MFMGTVGGGEEGNRMVECVLWREIGGGEGSVYVIKKSF